MSHWQYGYYIHGKSAHGTADTDMAGLLQQLQREADDLSGHRGLQAGSDHQTFSMSLPYTLRSYYDKVGRKITKGVLSNVSINEYIWLNDYLDYI